MSAPSPSGSAAAESNFSLWKVVTLSGESTNVFWEIWLSILLWMLISYALVHLVAGALSILMLRRHSWMPFLTVPFFAMFFVGPATFGAVTSASIALTFTTASIPVTCLICALLGITQTASVLVVSFSRLLATL
uniref:Transmembrane protein 170A n=1 Tax=Steinernema glaseri TaxID=37863 RepID=A0A1I7ZDL2_9BILA